MQDDSEAESDEDSLLGEDSDLEDYLDLSVNAAYHDVLHKRYVTKRKPYRKGRSRYFFERDLQEEDDPDGTPPWLNEDEFLEKYRMHRSSFKKLLEKIQDHAVFQNSSYKPQAPVSHQLLLFLHYLGRSGSGASNPQLRQLFGTGRGTADLYKRRVITAISSLRDEAIKWPDHEERKEIALRIFHKYQWINCIAIADGTLLPLTYEPQSEDAPDYHGRKFQYSLSTMIINDDRKKIRAYLAGFPGSTHDNRVYKNTRLAMLPYEYFGDHFYLVGDSAFENSNTVVASFKKPAGHRIPEEQERFNTHMGKLRVTSEHTIGLLKGRFPFLRSIPMTIKDNKNSVRRILRVIECCVILHNLMIDGGEDEIPDEWYDDMDDASEVGAAVGEYDFSAPIDEDEQNDERRQRCIEYFRSMDIV